MKTDFYHDHWCAVFELDQMTRAESLAVGYVYARLLKSTPPPRKDLGSRSDRRSTATSTRKRLAYSQMMNYLDQVFLVERTTPVDGRTRHMGQSANGLAMIELIGSTTDLTEATIIVGIPDDNPAAIAENSTYMLRFAMNADPTWSGSAEWLTSSLELVQRTASRTRRVHRGNLVFELELLDVLGMLRLTIKPQ